MVQVSDLEDLDPSIQILSDIKPAATKLIISPKAELHELLKLTLFDLILKQVLVLKTIYKKRHPNNKYSRPYNIIESGKNFGKYQADQFEALLLNRIDEDAYYYLNSWLKSIYNDLPSEASFKKLVIKCQNLSPYFKTNILSWIFSLFNLNEKGKALKFDIQSSLNSIDNQISELLQNDLDQALRILLAIKGNIFLLQNLKFEDLSQLMPSLKDKNFEGVEGVDLIPFDLLFAFSVESGAFESLFETIGESIVDSGIDSINFDLF